LSEQRCARSLKSSWSAIRQSISVGKKLMAETLYAMAFCFADHLVIWAIDLHFAGELDGANVAELPIGSLSIDNIAIVVICCE
jgi:hypothetical protein